MATDVKRLNEMSYTEDLKNEVKTRLDSIDVPLDAKVIAGQKVEEDDTFEIVDFDKVNSALENLIPFVFSTNNGKVIGAKNFAKIDWSGVLAAGVTPVPLGNSAQSVGCFCYWCRNNHIKFTVTAIHKGRSYTVNDSTAQDGVRTITPRTIELSVSL